MNREKVAFAVLKPIDAVLGAGVGALRATGRLQDLSDGFYSVAADVLGKVYKKNNDLAVVDAGNVPREGGVLFASNHQSWNDVQVIGATAPRRVRFLAKGEFETWPVLRQLIALSDSPFIRRGGDVKGMASAAEALRDGKALVIFPEGTIPGEEDRMRHEVEPHTGLLRGHTGAVRLAIEARVPIVPVGVSGTGRSFPPEVYPRLEVLRGPDHTPVTVRYGQPISYEKYYGRQPTHEELRALTDELMRAISALVDHELNYVPLKVPVPPLPACDRPGVLLLHGFTSSLKTVDGLVPLLEEAGLPYRMPVLRGHGSAFQDLEGVTAKEWYADAEAALLELSKECDKVVVVGLSMGGLVALQLAMEHPDLVAGVATLAAALRFADPLAPLSPVIAKIFRSWPSPESFNDKSLRANCTNYPRFMTDSFVSLLAYGKDIERRLPEVRAPLCVLQSKADQIVDPVSANVIYRDVSSLHREIHWFHKSGHEMGQDLEAADVFRTVMGFLNKFRAQASERAQAAG